MNTRRHQCVGLLCLAVAALPLRSGCAQGIAPPLDKAVARFVSDARESTRRYQSRQEAIDDGFTRVGVEFPAMGEHWVSFARILEDTFAASRPSVLIYVNVNGAPRLAGVGYTSLLTGSKRPPAFPFAGAWHEHSGAVDEESLPLGHGPHATAKPPTPSPHDDSPRLFILHAWIWAQNPEGTFVTDNWALPLSRLGVGSSETAPRAALRAITLADDDDEYNRLVVRATLRLSVAEDSLAGAVFHAYRKRLAGDVGAIRQTQRVTPAAAARLAQLWDALWRDLERALPARAVALRKLKAQL